MLEVLEHASACGVDVWVDGGWGVDALLGRQTRPHGDLDLALHADDAPAFETALSAGGFARCDEPSATPWNHLLADGRGAVVDLHGFTRDAEGNGVIGPPENGAVYPADALTGRGFLGDREVRCISPEWAVRFHDAYRGHADDRADVRALCARFDLPVPVQYRGER